MGATPTERDPAPAVLYAAKSTQDVAASIPTQLADGRAIAEREGWEVVGEHQDEGFSAYSGNRGPGLGQAKAAAVEAGSEHGTAMLVVQHSDRLARGAGDAPGAADHLVELFFELRRQRVTIVDERGPLDDPIRAVLEGERNTEDSARKAQATAKGFERSAERGDWAGGILADGYRVLREADDHGKVHRTVELDPDRRPIFDLIWDLARRGYSAGAIVAELDRNGYRTNPRKRGARSRPFDANRVRQTLDNPFYAGLSVHRGEVVGEGNWPRYVEPEDFWRLREQRRRRAHVERRGPGRPPEGYLLAGLAVCGKCGSPMDCVTGRHVRKDGTRPRRYVCRTHRERPQDCPVKPIDAALVDPAVIDNLNEILGDAEALRSGLDAAREADRSRLEGEAAAAQTEAKKLATGIERMVARVATLYGEDEDEKAAALEAALTTAHRQHEAARTRVEAAVEALADLQGEEPSEDEAAAFWTRLRAELQSRVDGSRGDVKRMTAQLADLVDEVHLGQDEDLCAIVAVTLCPDAVQRITAVTLSLDADATEVVGTTVTGGNPQPPW